jgi:hypothetical protein
MSRSKSKAVAKRKPPGPIGARQMLEYETSRLDKCEQSTRAIGKKVNSLGILMAIHGDSIEGDTDLAGVGLLLVDFADELKSIAFELGEAVRQLGKIERDWLDPSLHP